MGIADLDPKRFMLAADLMTEILGALAQGHRELVRQSVSPIGTLAVKSAHMQVDFEFSVLGKETKNGLGLTVRPPSLFGFSAGATQQGQEQQTAISNKATITLEIVNIAPPDDLVIGPGGSGKAPEPVETPPPEGQPPKRQYHPGDEPPPSAVDPNKPVEAIPAGDQPVTPQPPIDGAPPQGDGGIKISPDQQLVSELLKELLFLIQKQWPSLLPTIRTRAGEIMVSVNAGDDHRAKTLVTSLVEELHRSFDITRTRPQQELADLLARLSAYAGGARPAASNTPVIKGLPAEFSALNLNIKTQKEFARKLSTALQSGSEVTMGIVLRQAVSELAPQLAGKVLPASLLNNLEKLGLLEALNTGDPAWKGPFQSSLARLENLMRSLGLPEAVTASFIEDCSRAQASSSPVEAGSRLMLALAGLRSATDKLDLPAEVRATLDKVAPAGTTS